MRHIARDYSDAVFTNILKNIVPSMSPDSRILISEMILKSPPPLFTAFKDFTMLSLAGKERTLDNFHSIAEASGLRISGVFPDKATPHAVVEFALADG